MTREQVRAMLRRDEGFRARPYTDTTGHLTIGYGRNLSETGISLAEAETLLDHDIDAAEASLFKACPWVRTLDPVRRATLVMLCFNLGLVRLRGFVKMFAALQAGDYDRAADELLCSTYAAQVGQRANRYSALLRTGAW